MKAHAIAFLLCMAVVGCDDGKPPEPAPAPPVEPATEPVTAAPAPEPEPAPEIRKWPKPGWTAVKLEDELPLCVFADYKERDKVHFIEEATKQQLHADSDLYFSPFPSWCVNEGCDGVPSLQCSVERDGNTLTVHSRYWGYRKDDDSPCAHVPCRPITASCKAPVLERGVYTVKHGAQSFKLRVPSTLATPCFGVNKQKKSTPPTK